MIAFFKTEVECDVDWPYAPEGYDNPFDEGDYTDQINDIKYELVGKAINILDDLIYEADLDCPYYDIDLYDEKTYIEFNNEEDKDKIKSVLEELQSKLDDLTYKDYFTVWGKQIGGGYPSYDPPEYEEFEVEAQAYFDYTPTINFEES